MSIYQPDGFLAVPPAGRGPGVLVLHAWWGLNDTIKSTCNLLASSGYVVFAPDLYHGQVAGTIPEAERLGSALDSRWQQAQAEIAAAAASLSQRSTAPGGGIAVVAFSLGVYYALELADSDPDHVRAVVIYYGTGDGDYVQSKAAYQGHFAEQDVYEPQSNVDNLEAALERAVRQATFYTYPGTGHWFFEPDRVDAYDPAAAELAWQRTLAFLLDALPPAASK